MADIDLEVCYMEVFNVIFYSIAMIVVGKMTLKNMMSSIFRPYRPIVRENIISAYFGR